MNDDSITIPVQTAIQALDALLYTDQQSLVNTELRAAFTIADALGQDTPQYLADKLAQLRRPT